MTLEHPGTIVFVDADRGTETSRDASRVPDRIRFAATAEGQVPVVKVVARSQGRRRIIRSYDERGRVVSSTVQEADEP